MSSQTPPKGILSAMFGMRCPSCRKSFVFKNRSIFPFSQTTALKETCEECGQKLISEKNNGAGMNYALTMVIFLLNIIWFVPLYKYFDPHKELHWYDSADQSVWWYLGTSTFVVVVMQPWLMRMSRMVYLYLYVGFGASEN